VIEYVMIFLLGALAMLLLALMFLPLLSRRADRLARRRVEDSFPMSIREVTAERDLMRAGMAVEIRKAEARAEAALAQRGEDMAELGRRAVAIQSLEETVAEKDRRIGAQEAALQDLRTRLAEESRLLAEARSLVADLERRKKDLDALYEALQGLQAGTAAELGQTRAEVATLSERLHQARIDIESRDAAFAELSASHQTVTALAAQRKLEIAGMAAAVESIDRQRQEWERRMRDAQNLIEERGHTISEFNHKLAERDARLALTQRKLADAETDLGQAGERLGQLQRDRTALVEDGHRLVREAKEAATRAGRALQAETQARQRIAALQAEIAEIRNEASKALVELASEVETLNAERAAQKAALEQARGDRAGLQREVSRLKRDLAAAPAPPDFDGLRQAIAEIGSRLSTRPEAGQSAAAPLKH
jgi:chromosome segregation ATPase